MNETCQTLITETEKETLKSYPINHEDDTASRLISSRMSQIPFSGIRRSFDLAQKIPGLISLGLGAPDFDTPHPIKEAAKKALDDGHTHYTPNAGYLELRTAIAKKLEKENGIAIDPEKEIVVTVGAAEALFLTCQVLVSPGDEVIISDPYFVNYEPCIRAAGGVPALVPLKEENNFRLKAEEVKKAITSKTKGIIINSPHNPTGHVLTYEDISELASLALKHNLFVISDEVYEKIIYPPAKHYSIGAFPHMKERTITIQSFSKTYAMCGWRIGYAAGSRCIIEQITKLQQFCGIHAPSFAQHAALVAVKGSNDWIEDMVKEYSRRRAYLVKAVNEIPGLNVSYPDGSFYVFVNAKSFGMSSQELADYLLTEGNVAIVPGSALGANGEGYLRLCYTVSMEKLSEAVGRIKDALSKLKNPANR